MRKYIEILKYSLKTKTIFITDYFFSIFAFAIHVFVFNELWDYILKDKLIAGFNKAELIWYIIIGEMVTYSCYRIYKQIADMVKQGDIANMLIKPVDMINYLIVENSSVIIKAIINVIFAIILGSIMAGKINISLISIIFSIVAVLIAILMEIIIQILIGILAFFTEENKSIWLIVQKLSFFLLFTPLEFYPSIVQKIFLCLPTTYLVYTPAKIFSKFEIKEAALLLLMEILSLTALYIITRLVYKKGVEKINVNGG